jgi:hypothetical protein
MIADGRIKLGVVAVAVLALASSDAIRATAQEQPPAAPAEAAADSPEPLNADELEILVARIALYPDDLVAVVVGASLYPLQIVEAARFLDAHAKDASLQPKKTWDGAVLSLLNYPEIVRMMSEDLDWTQMLADAIAYQQKDVLIAIQQLRDEAVAKGVIKTDDKVVVVEENDNIVIQPASPEVIYVPQYDPQVFYVPTYVSAPVTYYPEPYPHYWYPGATFFAGAVTGALWAAAVDWDDWDVWGGDWDGDVDIDVDCNNCFNDIDFDGTLNFNDIDWTSVDRSKINIDRDQLAKVERTEIKNKIAVDRDNAIGNRAATMRKDANVGGPGKAPKAADIRKSTLEGLSRSPAQGNRRPGAERPASRPAAAQRDVARSAAAPAKLDRPVGKPKAAARADNRKKPSALGNVERGKTSKVNSNRGRKSMGGGQRGGGSKVVPVLPGGRRR